jgi:hypothetical protein
VRAHCLTDEIDSGFLLAHADEEVVLETKTKNKTKQKSEQEAKRGELSARARCTCALRSQATPFNFAFDCATDRLDISMDEILRVQIFNARDELVGEHEHGFEGEFAVAKVEHVLERGSQQLHHEDVEVALATKPEGGKTEKRKIRRQR